MTKRSSSARTTTNSASDDVDKGLRLAIAARATMPGVARARGIEITYRVGPRRYRRSYNSSIYLCAPTDAFTAETCPGEAEGRFEPAVADFPVAQ